MEEIYCLESSPGWGILGGSVHPGTTYDDADCDGADDADDAYSALSPMYLMTDCLTRCSTDRPRRIARRTLVELMSVPMSDRAKWMFSCNKTSRSIPNSLKGHKYLVLVERVRFVDQLEGLGASAGEDHQAVVADDLHHLQQNKRKRVYFAQSR